MESTDRGLPKMQYGRKPSNNHQHTATHRAGPGGARRSSRDLRPVAAFRQRGIRASRQREDFNAPEDWHEPSCRNAVRYIVQRAGENYTHPVTPDEVRARLAKLPERFTRNLEVVQFSTMTRKRKTFPCYGMQWGPAVYLYPIEKSLVERYIQVPNPQQLIEARMYGGQWTQHGNLWRLTWTESAIKDFYLNNVLIHEVGHLNDTRNTRSLDRERFANWFAIEYGYRATR